MGLRPRQGEKDDARPGLFACWATGEAREVTKMAYCSFYRGAAGEGDKGAMLACPRGECWTELHVGILRVAV